MILRLLALRFRLEIFPLFSKNRPFTAPRRLIIAAYPANCQLLLLSRPACSSRAVSSLPYHSATNRPNQESERRFSQKKHFEIARSELRRAQSQRVALLMRDCTRCTVCLPRLIDEVIVDCSGVGRRKDIIPSCHSFRFQSPFQHDGVETLRSEGRHSAQVR